MGDGHPGSEWEWPVDLYRPLLDAIGRRLRETARVLDLGCGRGEAVRSMRERGLDAWGCDLRLDAGQTERIRLIENPYRLPFAESSFDFVCSNQVLEHVQDYETTLAEVARVLRPQGASIHLFPPRYSLLERHTFVPLAGAIQTQGWLRLWAMLGVRNRFQRGQSADAVAKVNGEYLNSRTNYLRRSELLSIARAYFADARFIEREYLAVAQAANPVLRRINAMTALLARAYGGLRLRVLALIPEAP